MTQDKPALSRPTAAEYAAADLGRGIGITQVASLGNQLGAAAGALAFPAIGPIGVVAVRQLVAAVVLVPIGRPRFGSMRRSDWLAVIALALALTVMNTSVYLTIDRLGLGLAITLEFLGPLALVILAARRVIDYLAGVIAIVGVIVLVNPGPTSDYHGIGIGLLSACAWAAYILLNRNIGRRLPGVQGTATASLISAVVWLPVAIALCVAQPPPMWAIGLALLCGLASSVLPLSADMTALRLLPAGLFSTLQSMHPVWAAIVGFVLLGEGLAIAEMVGIGLVVLSNIIVTTTSAARSRHSPRVIPARPEEAGRRSSTSAHKDE